MKSLKFEYKITAFYLLVGCVWILFSDEILLYFVRRPELLTKLQTFKGWVYVLITGLLFYSLLKNHLIKLRNAEQKARESDRLKSVIIQNISHEIRTPMNAILGFTSILADENLTENQKIYLEKIRISSDRLLNIVNEIIDISLIETGTIQLFETSVNLNKFLDEVFSSINPLINKKLGFHLSKGLNNTNCLIMTDALKLRQVLDNLLDNAIKFTDRGHINFGYLLKEQMLEFFVEDTGIGIPQNLHSQIFEPFHKSETENKRLFEGVGLGLSICKGILNLINGEIWVRSQIDEGSVFYFTIPYKPVNQFDGE
jgi:signal transduction histidine kinase